MQPRGLARHAWLQIAEEERSRAGCRRTIPTAGLAVLPRTGHTCNLEEPELFDRLLERFFADVEHDAWGRRDPRSLATSTTGMDERA